MSNEEKEKAALALVKKLKRNLKIIKILLVAFTVSVAALLIFGLTANYSGLKESNFGGVLLGVVLIGSICLILVVSLVVLVINSKINLKKLEKLGEVKEDAA